MQRNKIKTLIVGLISGLLLALAALFFLHISAQEVRASSSNLFVSQDGKGETCSREAPCLLSYASGIAKNGDTIYLAGGLYTGDGEAVIRVGESITYTGGWNGAAIGPLVIDPDIHHSIIDGEDERRGIIMTETVTATISGLAVRHGYTSVGGGGGLYVDSANLILIDNTFSDCYGHTYGGGIYIQESNAYISGNVVVSNTTTNGGGGICIGNADQVIMHNNTFIGNQANYGGAIHLDKVVVTATANLVANNTGSSAWMSSGAAGYLYAANNILVNNNLAFSIYSENQAELVHNTLVNNASGVSCGFGGVFAATNNLFSEHTSASIQCDCASGTNNLFWHNTQDPYLLSNPVQSDPRLVNYAAGDYHLGNGSAAIDAGSPYSLTVDFEGDARPIGAGFDIGADERRFVVYLPLVRR